jgi:hypothetical protein
MTPVRRKSAGGQDETPAETYVVCLDCGKQFLYDWKQMRLGQAVDISDRAPASPPDVSKIPFRTKSKLRYLIWGSALSVAVVLGKAAKSRKRSRGASATGQDHAQAGNIKDPENPRTP